MPSIFVGEMISSNLSFLARNVLIPLLFYMLNILFKEGRRKSISINKTLLFAMAKIVAKLSAIKVLKLEMFGFL